MSKETAITLEPLASGGVKHLGLSQRINKSIRAAPQECFWNARKAIRRSKLAAGAVYVEGWAVMPDFPISFEHGWIESGAGIIIDPTLTKPGYKYYPVFRYTLDQVIAHDRDFPGVGPIYHTDPANRWGWNDREFQRGYVRSQFGAGFPVEWIALHPSFVDALRDVLEERGESADTLLAGLEAFGSLMEKLRIDTEGGTSERTT